MSISDERLAHLLVHPSHINPRYELPGIVTELQALRAAAKVRAIREGDGEFAELKASLLRLTAKGEALAGWIEPGSHTASKARDISAWQKEKDIAFRIALAASPIPATGGEKE